VLVMMDGMLAAQTVFNDKVGKLLFPDPPKPPEVSIDSIMQIVTAYNEAFALVNRLVTEKGKTFDELIQTLKKKVESQAGRT
jgi:hypothetical protein